MEWDDSPHHDIGDMTSVDEMSYSGSPLHSTT